MTPVITACTMDRFQLKTDLLCLPRLRCFERSHEHLVQPQRVGAVGVHDVVRVDDVSSRLAHLLPIRAEDHALLMLTMSLMLGSLCVVARRCVVLGQAVVIDAALVRKYCHGIGGGKRMVCGMCHNRVPC